MLVLQYFGQVVNEKDGRDMRLIIMDIKYGSKEHTQFAYRMLKDDCGNNTQTIWEFMNWLKQNDKLKHLKGMSDLSSIEISMLEQLLNK